MKIFIKPYKWNHHWYEFKFSKRGTIFMARAERVKKFITGTGVRLPKPLSSDILELTLKVTKHKLKKGTK